MSILGAVKRLLKIDHAGHADDATGRLDDIRIKLAELEESQAPLKRAVEDTGFFLGDALVRSDNERYRAIHHNR
jgi:hypothetical protein